MQDAYLYAKKSCESCKNSSTNDYAKALYMLRYLERKLKIENNTSNIIMARLILSKPSLASGVPRRIAFDLNEIIKNKSGAHSDNQKTFRDIYNLYDAYDEHLLKAIGGTRFDWVNDSLNQNGFTHDTTNIILFYLIYGNISKSSGNLLKAIDIYEKAKALNYGIQNNIINDVLNLKKETNYELGINEIINVEISENLFEIYLEMDSTNRALEQLEICHKYLKEPSADVIYRYHRGNIFLLQGDYSLAFEDIFYSLTKVIGYDEVIGETERVFVDPSILADIYSDLAKASMELGKFNLGDISLDKFILEGMQNTDAIMDPGMKTTKYAKLLSTLIYFYFKTDKMTEARLYAVELSEILLNDWDNAILKIESLNRDFIKELFILKNYLYNIQQFNSSNQLKEISYKLERCIEEISLTDKIRLKHLFSEETELKLNSEIDSLSKNINVKIFDDPNSKIEKEQERKRNLLDSRNQIQLPERMMETKNLQFDSISNSISRDEVIIKFFNFSKFENQNWSGNEYGCFLFIKNQAPKLLYLFSEDELENAMNNYNYLYKATNHQRNLNENADGKKSKILLIFSIFIIVNLVIVFIIFRHLKLSNIAKILIISFEALFIILTSTFYISKTNSKLFSLEGIYNFLKNNDNNNDPVSLKSSHEALFKLIWGKIEPTIVNKDISKFIISPVGMLNRVSFAELFSIDSILNKTELVFTMSLSEMDTTYISNFNSASIFGGIKYSIDSSAFNLPAKKPRINNDIVLRSNEIAKQWKDLPGTKEEKNAVVDILNRNNIPVTAYDSVKATEENFKSLSGNSPAIIHLATHGFYFQLEQKKDNQEYNSLEANLPIINDPMYRSGLILAGANLKWVNNINANRDDDGILTASEIADLDLTQTQLVVLSACESGLGDVKGGEGIYGLLRAFKIAGVKNVIVSLWKIDDKATKEFMIAFYDKLIDQKMKISTAFNETQKELRIKYSYDPKKWAGFQLYQ